MATSRIDRLLASWRTFEALLEKRHLGWAYHRAPPWLRHARDPQHRRGVTWDFEFPEAYRRFVEALAYPSFGTRYYDSAGLSFLPPESMAFLSAILAAPEGELPEPSKSGPTVCQYAFFAGFELSDIEGHALGRDGDEVVVWLVERGMVREVEGPFEEWAEQLLERWTQGVKKLSAADVKALEEENEGEDDPHRLIDYALQGAWKQRRFAKADLALAWVEDQSKSPYRYGLVDGAGEWLIPLSSRFLSVTPFRNGKAKVILNEKGASYSGAWVTIGLDGKVLE